jgi:hypothetical protein
MKTLRLIVTGAAALALLTFGNSQAEEIKKPSAAARQASKARDYATRDDKEGPADVAAGSTAAAAGQKEGAQAPVLETQAVDKAAKDTGETWKKLDKVLDRF